MKQIQKRLDLAVAVLTVLYLSTETINAVFDLLSKVVNYARTIRKLPLFLLEKR
jgi:hypothetical protein